MNTLELFRNESSVDGYSPGQVIFKEGDAADRMYVVKDGEVEVRIGDQVVGVMQAGDLLGEMALVDTSPRSATAVARTECRLVPIDQRRFTFLVQQTPFFSLHVMRVLADRLRRSNQRNPSVAV